MYKVDPACIHRQYGVVKIDYDAKKVLRTIPASTGLKDFFTSEAYKKALTKNWLPKVQYVQTKGGFDEFDVEFIPFITRANEWCTTQLLDVIIMLCDLQILLLKHGYYVSRPHCNNATFNPGPVMIDIGDIRKVSSMTNCGEAWHVIYAKMICDPHGTFKLEDRISNWLAVKNQIEQWIYRGDVDEKEKSANFVKKHKEITSALIAKIQVAKKLYLKMVLKDKTGDWSLYPAIKLPIDNDFSVQASIQKNKSLSLWKVLKNKKPKTLIDFGSSQGFYSFMGASLGAKVLGMELCGDAVAKAHKIAKDRNLNVRFIVCDFMKPPKAIGQGGCYRHLTKRIRSQAGYVPAVSHHLYRAGFGFKKQADFFSQFISEWLMIEFIPSSDVHIKSWGLPTAYSEGEFRKELSKCWGKITTLPSHPDPRVWLLCENKK